MVTVSKKMRFFLLFVVFFIVSFWLYLKFFVGKEEVNNKNYLVKNTVETIEYNSFKISFTEDMDKKSVKDNLKISPNIERELLWHNNKSLEIKIKDENIIDNQVFLLNITTNAKNIKWENLTNPIVKKFKVDWKAKVVFVSPEWEVSQLNKNITVRFSKPMVSLTDINSNSKICPIKISPEIKWECKWITTKILQFIPENDFSIWAKYKVIVSAWLKSISWDVTKENKIFNIITPKLKVLSVSQEIAKDENIEIVFNEDIDLDLFKNNINLSDSRWNIISIDKLNIDYEKEKNELWEEELNKHIILLSYKDKDFWYNKKYNLLIKSSIKSINWNVELWEDLVFNIKTKSFIKRYTGVSLLNFKDGFVLKNIITPRNKKIISIDNPLVVFYFTEDINISDKLFFVSSWWKKLDIELFIPKEYENDLKLKWWEYKEMLWKVVFIRIKTKLWTKQVINVKVKSPEDDKVEQIIKLFTSNYNKIKLFKLIDYKTICISTLKRINNSNLNIKDNIDFWENGEFLYINEVYSGSKCKKIDWLYNYEMKVLLEPNKIFDINISKNLLDSNNYKLDKSYKFKVKTWKIKNEDKYIWTIMNNDYILVPKTLNYLSLVNLSRNIDKINVEVCEGDFALDIWKKNFIKNKICNKKTLMIDNTWFDLAYNNINLWSVFWRDFTKQVITVKISKINSDIDKKSWESNFYKRTFIRNNIIWLSKTTNNRSLIWLYDLKYNSTILDSLIVKVIAYKKVYNRYTKSYDYKEWEKIPFTNFNDELIELNLKEKSNYDLFVFYLYTWENILFNNIRNYYHDNLLTYINVDKPIYKPWDKVNIKWFIRRDTATGVIVDSDIKEIELEIRDSNYNIIKNTKLKVDEIWWIDFNYILEKEAILWNYNIKLWNSNLDFLVQNYEKSKFKVEIINNKDSYNYWEKTDIWVSANYYAWWNLNWAKSKYIITAKDYKFDWWKEKDYIWWENNNYWWINEFKQDNPIIVDSWDFILDKDGKKNINIELLWWVDNNLKDKLYNIDFTIEDKNTKKTVSKNINFKVFKNKEFVWLKFDKIYYDYWDNIYIDIISVDKNGDSIKNKQIDFKIKKIYYEEVSNKLKRKEKELESKYLKTWIDGYLAYTYKIKDYWEIKIEASIPGSDFKTTKTFYIYWESLLRPIKTQNKLDIISKKDIYEPWEMWEITILSSLKWKALITTERLWEVLDYEIVDIKDSSYIYRFQAKPEYIPNFYIDVTILQNWKQTSKIIEELIKIRLEMNIIEKKLRILLKDNTIFNYFKCISDFFPIYKNIDREILERLSELRKQEKEILDKLFPRYESWKINIQIKKDLIKLKTKVTTDKKQYKPWEKQIINIKVNDISWKNINWEATIYIVDEALLDLKAKSKNDIINTFYGDKRDYVKTFNLLDNFIKRLDFSNRDKDNNKISFWWDLDSERVLSEASIPNTNKQINNSLNYIRKDFKDIAFYKWKVEIKDWKAQIEVPKLPDDLTKWIIGGFVVTKDTKIWILNANFKVKKDISLVSNMPRFFITWDELEIGSIVINNSNRDIEVTPSINITNAKILSNPEKSIVVKWDWNYMLKWKVKINKKDLDIAWNDFYSIINIEIKTKSGNDSLELKRKIYPYSTPEVVFTNWEVKDLSYEEKILLSDNLDKDLWELQINIWPTILTNLTRDIVNFFPNKVWLNSYYNFEILKKIISIINFYNIIWEKDKLNDIKITDENNNKYTLEEVINKSIERFKKYSIKDYDLSTSLQCRDKNCISYEYSFNVIDILNKLETIDYNIDIKEFKSNLVSWLKKQVEVQINDTKSTRNLIKKEYFMILLEAWEVNFIKDNFYLLRFDNSNIDKLYKIKFNRLLNQNIKEIKNILKELKNDIFIEARWSVLVSNNYYDNYKTTSLALIEFIENKETEKLVLENLTRYLITELKVKNIYWKSIILDAISKYIKTFWQIKDIDFIATTYLNSNEIMKYKFLPEDSFFSVSKNLSIKENLLFDKENSLGFEKQGTGTLYYDVALRYFLPMEDIEAIDNWITIFRNYYKLEDYLSSHKKECYNLLYYRDSSCTFKKIKNITSVNWWNLWDILIWEIEIIIPYDRTNIMIENFIPAWVEILNENLDTTPKIIKDLYTTNNNINNIFDNIWKYDNKILMFASSLNKWVYKYIYAIKLNHIWKYHNKPAIIQELEKPEIWGRTKWNIFEIK